MSEIEVDILDAEVEQAAIIHYLETGEWIWPVKIVTLDELREMYPENGDDDE